MKAIPLAVLAILISNFSYAECQENIIPSADPDVFFDQGDGSFLDSRTNLVWRKCPVGQAWSGTECSGEPVTFAQLPEALNYVNTNLPNWRIPSVKELVSIVDYSCSEPAARLPVYFSGASYSSFRFISSTPQLEETTDFTYTKCLWTVNFEDGNQVCWRSSDRAVDRVFLRLVKD